jgi:hypothetical protein
MSTNFGYIFWGLILAFLDFKINGLDLLPDVLGFGLIGLGAVGLQSLSPKFSLAGALSFFLAVSSLIGLAVSGEAAKAFSVVVTGINCAMFWSLLGGIGDYTNSTERHVLTSRAHNLRIGYVAMMCGTLLLGLTGHELGAAGALLGAAAVIAMIVVMVLILHLIHQVRY